MTVDLNAGPVVALPSIKTYGWSAFTVKDNEVVLRAGFPCVQAVRVAAQADLCSPRTGQTPKPRWLYRLAEKPEPTAVPGDSPVKVAPVGICGSDLPRLLVKGTRRIPLITGREFSGRITEPGDGGTDCGCAYCQPSNRV